LWLIFKVLSLILMHLLLLLIILRVF